MANVGMLLGLLKYAPMALEVAKAVKSKQEPAAKPAADRREMDDFKKHVTDRLADVESENARLRARLREAESLLNTLQLWVWIGGGVLGALTVLLLILVLVVFARTG